MFFPILCVYCLFSLLYFCSTLCRSLLRFGRFDSFPLFCLCLYFFFLFFVSFFLPFNYVNRFGIVVLCISTTNTSIEYHSSVSIRTPVDGVHICVHKRAYTPTNTCVARTHVCTHRIIDRIGILRTTRSIGSNVLYASTIE